MERHTVLFPGAALVNSAGISVCTVIWQWHPGEATNVRGRQGDIDSTSSLNRWYQLNWSVWVGGSHKSPILFELAKWPWDFVHLWEFTINPKVLLHVGNAGIHLWPSGSVPEPRVKIQEAGFQVWVCGSDKAHYTWQTHWWEKITTMSVFEIWNLIMLYKAINIFNLQLT